MLSTSSLLEVRSRKKHHHETRVPFCNKSCLIVLFIATFSHRLSNCKALKTSTLPPGTSNRVNSTPLGDLSPSSRCSSSQASRSNSWWIDLFFNVYDVWSDDRFFCGQHFPKETSNLTTFIRKLGSFGSWIEKTDRMIFANKGSSLGHMSFPWLMNVV